MPMPKTVHDVLSEKLGDVKVTIGDGEKSLLAVIEGWQDGDEAKGKVQIANKEISEERDTLKKEAVTLKEKVTAGEKTLGERDAEVKRLQTNALSDEDKAKLEQFKEAGMTPEVEAKVNTMGAEIEKLVKAVQEGQDLAKQEKEAAQKATVAGANEKLRSDLKTALGDAKVTGRNADLALNTILADGHAKIEVGDDGKPKTTIQIIKDGKPFEATMKDLAEHIAKTNENLVDASGNAGSGNDHSSGAGGSATDYENKTLSQIHQEGAQGLGVTK